MRGTPSMSRWLEHRSVLWRISLILCLAGFLGGFLRIWSLSRTVRKVIEHTERCVICRFVSSPERNLCRLRSSNTFFDLFFVFVCWLRCRILVPLAVTVSVPRICFSPIWVSFVVVVLECRSLFLCVLLLLLSFLGVGFDVNGSVCVATEHDF